MSRNQQSQKARSMPQPIAGKQPAMRSSRTAQAGAWRLIGLVAFVAGAVAVWGVSMALRPAKEIEPPSLAARLRESEAQQAPQGQPAPAAAQRAPLDPLVPETGAGLIAEAQRVATDLARRFPQNPDAQEMLGRFQFSFADLNEAASTWERCLELNPDYAYAHVGLASIATQRGDHAGAVAHCRRAILADPKATSHQIALGKALLAAGEIEEAIVVLRGVVRIDPNSPQAHAELGAAQLQKRDDAAAKSSFESVLKLDPRYAQAHSGLAVACARLGLTEQAREQEAKVREFRADRKEELRGQRLAYDDDQALRQDIARLYTDMGGVFVAEGHSSAAEQLWRRAARLHPENLPCRQALAWLFAQQNKPWKAILVLRDLSRVDPLSAAYPAEIARLYVGLSRHEDAQRALQEFVETAPDNPAAQRTLADFYLQVKKQPQLASEHARRAAELSAAAADWALLAAAKEATGELPAAIAALEEASRRAPENLQYRQYLALLQQRAAAEQENPKQPKGDVPALKLETQPTDNR
jgi:tetratricopeptide (TPR) repeat protein